MNRKEIEEKYRDEKMLFADGFDKAIIGVAHIHNKRIVAYDTKKCIKIIDEGHDTQRGRRIFRF